MKRLTIILSMALGLGLSFTANAAVILDKALDLTEYGWNSNYPNTFQQSTDDVQLSSSATVDRLEWYGFDGGGVTSFRIRLFDNVAENIVTTHFYQDEVTATAVDTGLDHNSFDVFRYSADITDVNLSGGTRYELSIMSADPSTWTWNHSGSEGGNDLFHRNGDADTWREIGGLTRDSHAFTLLGAVTVPEPTALALIGLGLAGFAFNRKRKAA